MSLNFNFPPADSVPPKIVTSQFELSAEQKTVLKIENKEICEMLDAYQVFIETLPKRLGKYQYQTKHLISAIRRVIGEIGLLEHSVDGPYIHKGEILQDEQREDT